MKASKGMGRDIAPLVGASRDSRTLEAPLLNRLLLALTPRSFAKCARDLQVMDLAAGFVLYAPHERIEHVYFPDTAVASMVRRMNDGSGIEVGTIGHEGLSGVAVVLGATSMPTQCLIQVAGIARRMPAAALIEASRSKTLETTSGLTFGAVLDLYAQSLFEIVAQSAACNRLHTLEQRCARWLLMTHDRVVGDEMLLTQEFLSYMLGVRRAGVTEAAGSLQRSGLISYRHGRITIKDREGLENAACECYDVGVAAYETLLPGVAERAAPDVRFRTGKVA